MKLPSDIHFGRAGKSPQDWRNAGDTDQDPDDEEIQTTADVTAVLGFDPAKGDDE
jgi:hypothetical protein